MATGNLIHETIHERNPIHWESSSRYAQQKSKDNPERRIAYHNHHDEAACTIKCCIWINGYRAWEFLTNGYPFPGWRT